MQPPYGSDPVTTDPIAPPPVDGQEIGSPAPSYLQPPSLDPGLMGPPEDPNSLRPIQLTPPPKHSIWQDVAGLLPTALGAGLALTAKHDRQGFTTPGGMSQVAIGAGLAHGGTQAMNSIHDRQSAFEDQQTQALSKSLSDRIEQLRMAGGYGDPRVHQVIDAYDKARVEGQGILHPQQMAQIDSLLNSIPDLGQKAEDFKQKQTLDLFKKQHDITTADALKIAQFKSDNAPDPMDKPSNYVIRMGVNAQGKPALMRINKANNTSSPVPGGDIAIKNGHTVYTDPTTGQQSIVEVPTTYQKPGKNGGGVSLAPPPGGISEVSTSSGASASLSTPPGPKALANKGGSFKLPPDDKKTLETISTARKMMDGVSKALGPNAGQGGVLDDISSGLNSRSQGALYSLGLRPTDPKYQKIMALGKQLQLIASQPYAKNSRAIQWLNKIQEHIPDPSKDSEGLMVEKLANLSQTLGYIEDSIKTSPTTVEGARNGGSAIPASSPLKTPPKQQGRFLIEEVN